MPASMTVLLGGVISNKFAGYNLVDAMDLLWLERAPTVEDGGDYGQVAAVLCSDGRLAMPADRRPMIAIAKTTKGYWPGAVNGQLRRSLKQIIGYPSHPYGYKMNSDYFVALAETFEKRYGVTFDGIRNGAVSDEQASG